MNECLDCGKRECVQVDRELDEDKRREEMMMRRKRTTDNYSSEEVVSMYVVEVVGSWSMCGT